MREAFSAWKRFSTDRKGVVSFEYVIITAAIVTATVAAFNTDAAGSIRDALTSAMGTIIVAVQTASGR